MKYKPYVCCKHCFRGSRGTDGPGYTKRLSHRMFRRITKIAIHQWMIDPEADGPHLLYSAPYII
jgi:Fe-S cluster biosynthesis and repair protein YggX